MPVRTCCIIISVITKTVRNTNTDLSQYDNLVQTIINQLRPVVLSATTNAIASAPKNSHLNARALTEEILIKITPFVREAVQQEIKKVEAENRVTPEEIVDNIIAQLKPITIKVIKQTVHGKNGADINDEEGLVQTIVRQLRPVVFAQVSAAIKANNANYDAQSMSNQIVQRLVSLSNIIISMNSILIEKRSQCRRDLYFSFFLDSIYP